MLKIDFALKNETKTCYRFQSGDDHASDMITLYLKKSQIDEAGIDPNKGITVTVEGKEK